MELYLKITAGLLLIVHAFHLASLQDSTDSPGRTIDKSWLRELAKNTAGSQNSAVAEEEGEYDQDADATTMEPSNDFSSGIASGSMAVFNSEEENLSGHENSENTTSDDLTVVTPTLPPTFPNGTAMQAELPDEVSQTNITTDPTNSTQGNMTEAEEDSRDSATTPQTSTTHLILQNSTSFPDFSNRTGLEPTGVDPQSNATQEPTTKPEEGAGSANITVTTMTTPEPMDTTTMSSSMTELTSETTETSLATTTATPPNTPEKANKTDKGSASGSSSERGTGLSSDSHKSKRNGAWGAVLGTAVAVAVVGLVAYVILKKKHQKGFTHRKLVEEYPSDPVLRLDNSEPLDLNFGGSAYYNPGLQGDNIQMTNFPGRHRN